MKLSCSSDSRSYCLHFCRW